MLYAIQGKAATGCAKHKSDWENSISSAGKMKTAFKCVPAKENNHLELIDSSWTPGAYDQFTALI